MVLFCSIYQCLLNDQTVFRTKEKCVTKNVKLNQKTILLLLFDKRSWPRINKYLKRILKKIVIFRYIVQFRPLKALFGQYSSSIFDDFARKSPLIDTHKKNGQTNFHENVFAYPFECEKQQLQCERAPNLELSTNSSVRVVCRCKISKQQITPSKQCYWQIH